MLTVILLNICVIPAFKYIYIYNDRRTCYTHIKYMIKRAMQYSNYYYIIRVFRKQHNTYVRKYSINN